MLIRWQVYHDSIIHRYSKLVNIYNNNQKKHEYYINNNFISHNLTTKLFVMVLSILNKLNKKILILYISLAEVERPLVDALGNYWFPIFQLNAVTPWASVVYGLAAHFRAWLDIHSKDGHITLQLYDSITSDPKGRYFIVRTWINNFLVHRLMVSTPAYRWFLVTGYT